MFHRCNELNHRFMSVQATSWVIENSQHKGSVLLLMLMIANHAHADGTGAFPSTETLARECRMSRRQVIRMLEIAERSGELLIDRSKGRSVHHYTIVMEPNRDKMSQLKQENRDTAMSQLNNGNCDKLSQLEDPNCDISDPPTVTFSTPNCDIAMSHPPTPPYKEEPLGKEEEKRGGEPRARAPANGQPTAADFGPPQNGPESRFYHPALAAIREITKHSPDRVIWGELIATLGSDFDRERLEKCFRAWRLRGFRTNNYGWITDWYVNGIREYVPGGNGNGLGKVPDRDADCTECSNERRKSDWSGSWPCPSCRPLEYRGYLKERGKL